MAGGAITRASYLVFATSSNFNIGAGGVLSDAFVVPFPEFDLRRGTYYHTVHPTSLHLKFSERDLNGFDSAYLVCNTKSSVETTDASPHFYTGVNVVSIPKARAAEGSRVADLEFGCYASIAGEYETSGLIGYYVTRSTSERRIVRSSGQPDSINPDATFHALPTDRLKSVFTEPRLWAIRFARPPDVPYETTYPAGPTGVSTRAWYSLSNPGWDSGSLTAPVIPITLTPRPEKVRAATFLNFFNRAAQKNRYYLQDHRAAVRVRASNLSYFYRRGTVSPSNPVNRYQENDIRMRVRVHLSAPVHQKTGATSRSHSERVDMPVAVSSSLLPRHNHNLEPIIIRGPIGPNMRVRCLASLQYIRSGPGIPVIDMPVRVRVTVPTVGHIDCPVLLSGGQSFFVPCGPSSVAVNARFNSLFKGPKITVDFIPNPLKNVFIPVVA